MNSQSIIRTKSRQLFETGDSSLHRMRKCPIRTSRHTATSLRLRIRFTTLFKSLSKGGRVRGWRSMDLTPGLVTSIPAEGQESKEQNRLQERPGSRCTTDMTFLLR